MKCAHCSLEYQENQLIKVKNLYFCCNGCKSVYEIIKANNLDEFYKNANNLSKVEISNVDKSVVFKEKISTNITRISFNIPNIHCSACVWLIEKFLLKNEAIVSININYFSKRAQIEFVDDKTNIQEIINQITKLGYKILPLSADYNKAYKNHQKSYSKLIVAVVCVMNIMWLSIASWAGYFSSMDADIKDIINFAEFILASPVLFYTALPMFDSAKKALKLKSLNMDCLVVGGALIAYIYSLYAMFLRLPYIYFDSVAMIICFVYAGKFLENLTKKNAIKNVDFLSDLINACVNVVKDNEIKQSSVYEIKKGDILRFFTGDKILFDGLCVGGKAKLNTSAITGEARLKSVEINSKILSSSVVYSGSCDVKTECEFKDSYIQKIANILNNTKKSNLQKLTDKISSYFCFVIFTLAFICFLLNIENINQAIIRSVSVLIIACPCALALSAPVCNLCAINQALKHCILFKNANDVENLSKIKYAVFDKTGVLTSANLKLSFYKIYSKIDILEDILSLNNHILALSIKDNLKLTKHKINNANYKQIDGKGVIYIKDNKKYFLGSAKFLKENGIKINSFNKTEVFFADENELLAYFVFESKINNGALELISFLQDNNIECIMLSGDKEQECKKIAQSLNITKYKFECLPTDKIDFLHSLNSKKILMVGDGINDALALKHALVSISFKQASDLAKNTSDIIILDDNLSKIKSAVKLAKRTYFTIKTNLFISLFYNLISLPLAFNGYINPLIAALFMSFSSICVILNAQRLNNFLTKEIK